MDKAADARFLRKFSALILFFVVLTVFLIFLAFRVAETEQEMRPSQVALLEERTRPIGSVRVGEDGAAALAEAQQAAAPPVVESTGPVDGEAVYGTICMSCHDAGVAGAPVKQSEVMAQRLDEKGLDMLVTNAINGIGIMPPKGGNPTLTDEEIRAAVEFMLP